MADIWIIGVRLKTSALRACRATTATSIVLAVMLALAAHPAGAAAGETNVPGYLVPGDARAAIDTGRGADGRLTVHLRGAWFDGRRLIASLIDEAWRGTADDDADFDLHMRVATLGGFNGERLTDVDLVLSRHGGRMRQFLLSARATYDAAVRGGLRAHADGRPFIHLETDNAGALLRFADIFAHVTGGSGWMALDLRPGPAAKRDGVLQLREFGLPDERLPQDLRGAAVPPSSRPGSRLLEFSNLRAAYALAPGQLTISRMSLYGPLFGATLEGLVQGDSLNLRGHLLPRTLAQTERANCQGRTGCLYGMIFTMQGKLQTPRIQITPSLDMSNLHLFDDYP